MEKYKIDDGVLPKQQPTYDHLSWERRQVDYVPKQFFTTLSDATKIGFGFAMFIQALLLANDYQENPAQSDSKYYYAFMSMFMMFNGLDSLIDFITSLSMTRCPKCMWIFKIAIVIFQLPFVIIGFTMATERMSTSWSVRKRQYTKYELSFDYNYNLYNLTQ